jgi:hypothetical protein
VIVRHVLAAVVEGQEDALHLSGWVVGKEKSVRIGDEQRARLLRESSHWMQTDGPVAAARRATRGGGRCSC